MTLSLSLSLTLTLSLKLKAVVLQNTFSKATKARNNLLQLGGIGGGTYYLLGTYSTVLLPRSALYSVA